MNGRYSLVDTPEERIAIAVVSALHEYFKQHPQGVAPGQGFLTAFLKDVVDQELDGARLDELHHRMLGDISLRERQLIEQRLQRGKRISGQLTYKQQNFGIEETL